MTASRTLAPRTVGEQEADEAPEFPAELLQESYPEERPDTIAFMAEHRPVDDHVEPSSTASEPDAVEERALD